MNYYIYRDFLRNTNVKFFPPDFFEEKMSITKRKEDKRIIIDLAKEEEEDKELLEILEGKRKNQIKNNNNNNYNSLNNIKNNLRKKNDENDIFNNNHVIKKKEKNKILLINKQKNVSANTSSKNAHVSRLLNLKKLKSQNNINDAKPLNNKKDTKYVSVFDNFLSNNKNKSEELQNDKYIPSTGKRVLYNKKYNINNNINANDDSPSVSTLAYTKKYTSNSINTQNLTEDHNNKFRVGLLSAFSNSNNNIFIPFLPMQRPLSNFNLGGQLNMENLNSEKITNNTKQINLNLTKRNVEKIKIKNDIRPKISTAPAKKREYDYLENLEKKKNIKKNYSNLFSSMNFYGQKFHHIKIDKSLMNNRLKESLNKNMILNYMNLGQNKFPRIKKNYQFNEIKKMFNIRNNSTKS